jgi:hypothetical protein
MESTIAYRVHVKLGPAEFKAVGPEETVKEQLAQFYIAASQPPASHGNGNGRNGNGAGPANGNGHGNGNGAESAPLAVAAPDLELRTDVDPRIIGRLFKEENGCIMLRALPKGGDRNAEALLLILWGYYVLKNQIEVTGRELVTSIRQSGINLPRVDETLSKKDVHGFITTGGAGRRKFYSLNNSGLEHAASQARKVFE